MGNRIPKNDELSYRAGMLQLSGAVPATLDREKRSVDFVISSENPVNMPDFKQRAIVPEVLLTKGATFPAQIPLLDTHDRNSTKAVLGSVRNIRKEGSDLVGTAFFSSDEDAERAFNKYAEGHLTDFSVGYKINDIERVMKGEQKAIAGRTWTGPVNVATSWAARESSCCPIGTDETSKVRAEFNNNNNIEDEDMGDNKELEAKVKGIEKGVTEVTESVRSLTENLSKRFEEMDAIKTGEQDLEKMRADAIKKKTLTVENEKKRILEIDTMCERFNIDDAFRADLITDPEGKYTVDQARALIMERIAARGEEDLGLTIKVGKDGHDKLRAAMTDGLMLRAGIATENVEDKDNPYRGHSLAEMARECLRYNNQPVPSSKEDLFTRALSTDDFDNIMADAANKALNDGFEKADETYSAWVDTTGVLNDYKGHQFSRASEAPGLQSINPEGGEYTYGIMTDTKETVTAADYGIIVPFTRAAMINDDLGALQDIRTKLGEAAARKYGDLVYNVLTGGTSLTMGDGTALFHASHSNYVTAGAAPTEASVSAGYVAMATQKDLQGLQNLNITPEYIIAPFALRSTIRALLHDTTPVVVGTTTVNPLPGTTPVFESRLDTANANGWYLAARKGKTVKLFTLNGQMAPTIESKSPWATDGMEFKCRISGAAAPMDYRGLYYNDGVT